jgi:hypothetical protein
VSYEFFKATPADGGVWRFSSDLPGVVYEQALLSGEVVRPLAAAGAAGDPAPRLAEPRRGRWLEPEDFLRLFRHPELLIHGGLEDWPARLFACVPVGSVPKGSPEYQPDAVEVTGLRVVAELPAHRVFGPQGVEVAAVVERSGRLSVREIQALERRAGGHRSHGRSRRGVEEAWAEFWRAPRSGLAWSILEFVCGGELGYDDPLPRAPYAAGMAAAAWVVRDQISPEHFELLWEPWKHVMGNLEEQSG